MDKSSIKYVIVIQCDNARKRCSGFACSNSFFNKEFAFTGYGPETRYLTMTCGGCNGSHVAGYLEHFSKKLGKKTEIKKNEVAIHLSTCMCTDNHHHDRCPYIDYIKDILRKKGYENVHEGSYKSLGATRRRENGTYKTYDSVDLG